MSEYPKCSVRRIARKRIAPIILKSGDEKLLALSTLMLDATENFFVRPSHLLSWPDEKRETIEKSFMTTISEAAYLKAKPEFMLFWFPLLETEAKQRRASACMLTGVVLRTRVTIAARKRLGISSAGVRLLRIFTFGKSLTT